MEEYVSFLFKITPYFCSIIVAACIIHGCVSYCMVWAYVREDNQRALTHGLSPPYVREDNPRALASGLSLVHMHNHTITALLHQRACALCALRNNKVLSTIY